MNYYAHSMKQSSLSFAHYYYYYYYYYYYFQRNSELEVVFKNHKYFTVDQEGVICVGSSYRWDLPKFVYFRHFSSIYLGISSRNFVDISQQSQHRCRRLNS